MYQLRIASFCCLSKVGNCNVIDGVAEFFVVLGKIDSCIGCTIYDDVNVVLANEIVDGIEVGDVKFGNIGKITNKKKP